MPKNERSTIGQVLADCQNYLWSDSLYMPGDVVWQPSTPCLVCDPDDVASDEDELPVAAAECAFDCSLPMQIVQSIVKNARQQLADLTLSQLFEAFLYYYDNDAFIDFTAQTDR